MVDDRSNETLFFTTDVKAYYWTEDLFIKRELCIQQRPIDFETKQPATLPFLQERFFHEANSLRFLAENTAIPVPEVVDVGIDQYGLAFLKTKYAKGTIPAERAGEWCSLPSLHKPPNASQPCSACADVAKANINSFVDGVVLPELRKQKSCETGLNGFVIPPRWVMAVDKRKQWKVKTSRSPDFVFVLHDLVQHNLLLSSDSLEVAMLVDTEESGFFPPEMQQWKFDRIGQGSLYRDKNLVARDLALLS